MSATAAKRSLALLDWPLEGTHRIEASAGTGKTFALALLHTRLVVERDVPVKRILAVTYTIAATQELRERLRNQLGRAAALALLDPVELHAKCTSEDAAEAATAAALERRLQSESAPSLAERLRRAVSEIDLAPIHTIHAFCQRVLSHHALASGEPLQAGEILTSERALHEEVALDVWRRFTRERHTAAQLETLWKAPDLLARDLRLLAGAETLLPARSEPDATALAAFDASSTALREAWHRDGLQARHLIETARSDGVLHRGRPADKTLDAIWASLAAFGDGAALDDAACKNLGVLTPAGIAERVTKKYRLAATPTSPLFAMIEVYLATRIQAARAVGEARANLLHNVCDSALARLAALKRERGLLGFDDLVDRVHAALASENGAQLARDLRRDYPVALVDEFQDTDAKQWDIFSRIYVRRTDEATRPALFLIGDPKQAIYRFRGGDVHTYHAAGAFAEATQTLERNFRSRSRMIEAIAAVFAEGGETPFADEETHFPRVLAAGRIADGDLTDGKRAVPGLHLLNLSRALFTGSAPSPMRSAAARDIAAAAAAARIQSLLTDAPLYVRRGEKNSRVEPGDIAVLVNRHEEAVRMQRELAARGIASVTATRASVFNTAEANELVWIFEALLAIGDEGRLGAALATVLLGADAAAIDALSRDEALHRSWLDAFQLWREKWQRFGPLPFVSELVAAAAPRLLKLADGERRLSNYLQLAEAMQTTRARVLGETGQADWLARRIADADDFDEAQQLRLESDAKRVQIMTLHKAKGLEFDLVFLPFAGLAPADASSSSLGLIVERVDGRRALRARIDGLEDDAYAAALAIEKREILAEQLRLLYVGLTRARYAAWLFAAPVYFGEKSALSWLLHRTAEGRIANVDAAAIDAAFARLVKAAPRAIVCEEAPDLVTRALPFPADDPHRSVVRESHRLLRRDWWVYSFSQLKREEGNAPERAIDDRGAEDETELPNLIDTSPSPYAGARFGNALHAALETVDFARWRNWQSDAAPADQESALHSALGANGYAGEDTLASGSRVLAALVRATLNVGLPEGVRLVDLPPNARRSELEFHFAFQPIAIDRLIETLHRHRVLAGRESFGARSRIEGLMTGRIDLVYEHAGRVYLLDYKSNRLTDYSQTGLARAMLDSEYDLQYLIYTLAVHRWLRFRRADYDYDTHFGGVRYVFCRGLDPASADSPGIFVARPSRAFIDEIDALLAPPRRVVA